MPVCPDCYRNYPDDMTSCPHCGKLPLEMDATVTTPHDEYGTPLPDGAAAVQVSPGMILAEQYKVLQRIGSGGMGEVWKAMDMELETIVAIKVLPPELARNPLSVRRLRREAMIGQRLTHPAICRLYGFHSQSDIKFIVMEYVEGKTLQQLLAARLDGRASWDQVKSILRQVALALDFAHRVAYQDSFGHDVRGVLHRDIKPSNIMVTSRGQARLMDFGIASEIHNTMTHLTGNSSLTPLYASPEQFRGDNLTPASDIYSFSTVVYQCLSGHRYVQPHGDLKFQVLEKPYRPIDEVPQSVNGILEKGLAKSPDQRPGSARELIDELDEAFAQPDEPATVDDETGATSATATPSPGPTEPARRVVPMADQVLGRPVHGFPTRAVLVGAGLFVGLVILVVVLASMGGDRGEPARQVSAAELDDLKRTAGKLMERVEKVDPADGLGVRVLALDPLRRHAEQSPDDIQEAWRRYSLLVDRAGEVLALDEARRAARDARPIAEKAMQAARETGLEQDDAEGFREAMLSMRAAEAAWEGGEFAEAEKHWARAAEMFDTRRMVVQGRSYLEEAQSRYRQAMDRIDRQRVMQYRAKAFKKVLDAADEAERLGQEQAYQKAIEAYHKATADLLTAAAEADAQWQREHAGDVDRQVTTLLAGARRALEENEFDDVRRLLAEVSKLKPDHPEIKKLEARLAALDLAETLRLDLGDGIHVDCVLIPKGTFRMGSAQDEAGRSDNERRHEVTLSRAFYMSVAEVSQAQYRAVMGKNPSRVSGDALPVHSVTWTEAEAFCLALSKKTGRPVALPTEAQWEYACRAGAEGPYAFGRKLEPAQAVFAGDKPRRGPAPTGTRPGNAWKLADMHGNVQEWCRDAWHDYPAGKRTDPLQRRGSVRVVRGGSWSHHPSMLRSAARGALSAEARLPNTGFRIVVETGRVERPVPDHPVDVPPVPAVP